MKADNLIVYHSPCIDGFTAACHQKQEIIDSQVERIAELTSLLWDARLAMMEPHGEWKDIRENKAIVAIRDALEDGDVPQP